jgi:hypothetical protein
MARAHHPAGCNLARRSGNGQPRMARMTAASPSSFSRCTVHPPGSGSAPGRSQPTRPPPSGCISTAHPGPARKPPPRPLPLASVSRARTPPSSTLADTADPASANLTEPEKDTLQSPSAHPGYLVPPPLGACVSCGALVLRVAVGFGVACAFRDWPTVGEEDAEGSAARGLVGEAAREAVLVAAVSGLDGVAMAEDSELESQPATAKASSNAPIAVRFM